MISVPIKQRLMSPGEYYAQLFAVGEHDRKAVVNCVFHGDRSPSLSIDLNSGRYHCFGCGSSGGDILDFHRALHPELSFIDALSAVSGDKILPSAPRVPHDTEVLNSNRPEIIWKESEQLQASDDATKYLLRRGLNLQKPIQSLRLHKALGYWERSGSSWILSGTFPALIAKVESLNGELIGIHKTYLNGDGLKAPVVTPKKIMSVHPGATKGGAIRLAAASEIMAVGEGIESTLAYCFLSDLPAWAAMSATGLESVQFPEIVKRVYIAVDLDRNCRGEQAANVLARRLINEGRKVFLAKPPGGIPDGLKSFDWLDFLNRSQRCDPARF